MAIVLDEGFLRRFRMAPVAGGEDPQAAGLHKGFQFGLHGPEFGLAVAGLFEFNFGDTEVFYLMLELFALMIALTEKRVDVDRWLVSMAEVGAAAWSNSPRTPFVRMEPGLSSRP